MTPVPFPSPSARSLDKKMHHGSVGLSVGSFPVSWFESHRRPTDDEVRRCRP